MDAPTIVSLSAACGYAVPEALVEEMRQRELERMRRHDLESYVAQTHYTHDLQVTRRINPRTWLSWGRRAWVTMQRVHALIVRAWLCVRQNRHAETETLLVEAEFHADWELWRDSEDEDDVDV